MPNRKRVAIIGGGPAGLMAAEAISLAGAAANIHVDLFEAMPSLARKFLLAGKGGMNITHSEPNAAFRSRYGTRQDRIAPLLDRFGPEALCEWIHGLGIDTFVGSSGRVFPTGMKAAPLLRTWLHRLRADGVHIHVRHRWCAIERQADGIYSLCFDTPKGEQRCTADVVVLALGGGSWAKLGSDGRWVALLEQSGVPVAPLRPSNCGFDAGWSKHLRERFAGQPVKPVAASFTDAAGGVHRQPGEFMITEYGVEGGLIYALSAPLRDSIEQTGSATLTLDLLPGHTLQRVTDEVVRPRGSRSLSSHLQSRLGLKGVKTALLNECIAREDFSDAHRLAVFIKALPLRLIAPRPLDEAISSAGGVVFEALDEHLMIRHLPGVFCAGEMLDWEAPTGGYLLTACFASGHAAGLGALAWLQSMQRTCQPSAII
ncbi:MAG: TIGR03862 family flavoprotein [Propionivibrio sp.]|uniref:TIGR03862 family flavoprotein n=1 Tax=Propionivibrio sp. TaxID=2212460 RepID=UPI001A56D2AF|nr:TIGR03862 family flavoprotein [Propionivibrio sp.]MBL8414186.1 TIGR03862 family flavoprotein [Propionivibrio sp.]